jgi:septum formation protein
MPKIVLASQSTSRKRLLVDAGLRPEVIVSHVDEETEFFNAMSPADMVIALAISKAHTVREMIDYPAIIIGCDSTFDVDGISFGKPGTPEVARQRARAMSGRSGLLHTGHCIIDTEKASRSQIASLHKSHFQSSQMTRLRITSPLANLSTLQEALLSTATVHHLFQSFRAITPMWLDYRCHFYVLH